MKTAPPSGSAPAHGFALVLVLLVLLLVAGLAIGLLGRLTSERTSTAHAQASVSTRQLADMAVGLVQGQINLATRDGLWVSQPGMIRTLREDGTLRNAYKLYTAAEMIATSAGITDGVSDDAAPDGWPDAPVLWTDLNAPVEIDGTLHFPILDPNATAEGYRVADAPDATAYQPVPMPVRWLYALRDGSLVAPVTDEDGAITIAETADNPIVGRIALWSDDETCKVNLNTASEGVYWDTPRAASLQEIGFARYQPAQKEFQRYPGHPAMTSLSAVFPGLDANAIYGIVPRIVGGGSEGGTAIASAPLAPDADRLFANVDELIFTAARNPQAGISQEAIRRARFFLTARSRAPETNLFSLPRVAIWPVYDRSVAGWNNYTTAFDRLIAFTSTINERSYFFQRRTAASPTADSDLNENKALYGYLRDLTTAAVPGFGASLASKYGDDSGQILTEIFDSIRTTNLADSTLSASRRYAGNGVVQPARIRSGAIDTLGMGRFWTFSELAIGFICNAQPDDPATPDADESSGSNDPATNRVFAAGEPPLSGRQRYVQAIIVPEFFSPMQGWIGFSPNLRMRITGLDGLSVEGQTLFPAGLDDEAATFHFAVATYLTHWGGSPGWRVFGINQVSPARGNLPGDVPGNKEFAYPFISIPLRIEPAGGTMQFGGGSLVVEIYPPTGPIGDETCLQRIRVAMPSGDFPLPELVSTGTERGDIQTAKQNWWAFSRSGAVDGFPGRLANIAQRPWAEGIGAGDFFRAEFPSGTVVDTVRSVLPGHGDFRLVAGRYDIPEGVFVKHPHYDDATRRMAHNLSAGSGTGAGPAAGRAVGFDTEGAYLSAITYPNYLAPDIPSNATQTPEATGDFDTGLSLSPDGAFVNKPDEGNIRDLASNRTPYFDAYYQWSDAGTTFFSPNRQIASPGVFGSLPTGVQRGIPWQTLLFRPQPGHPGAANPPDHLWMDLFWMPVVEPYAISDRFSTAGKINLNHQILPFTWVTRSTGLNALLKAERLAAIPNSAINTYKPATSYATVAPENPDFRLPIDAEATLTGWRTRFRSGEIFRSASEVCDLPIIPTGHSAAEMASGFWKDHALTGDNLRERIYTTLYPRLTSRSNTFSVHYRVQALRKSPRSPVGTWDEARDHVLGEARGATVIERFIAADNPDIPDYPGATDSPVDLPNLETFYKWRILEERPFSP